MPSPFVALGASLLLQAGTLPDTIVTKTIPASPGWFDQVTGIASGLMSIALVGLAIAVIPAAWNLRNSHKKISDVMDRVYGDINPIMRHASSIADNLDYITTSIRTDVQQVNATIAAANQRLHEAVNQTEERLNEFNALIAVVQEEAERLFVSSAATARGVRAGAAVFGADLGVELTNRRDAELLDLEELATMNAFGPRVTTHNEETARGIDDDADPVARYRSGPRVRPRTRRSDLA